MKDESMDGWPLALSLLLLLMRSSWKLSSPFLPLFMTTLLQTSSFSSSSTHRRTKYWFQRQRGTKTPTRRHLHINRFNMPSLSEPVVESHRRQRPSQDVSLKDLDPNAVIRSRCQCGRVELTVPIHAIQPLEQTYDDDDETNANSNSFSYKAAVDCHCPSCRKFHVAAFASYLLAKQESVHILDPTNSLTTYRDSCSQLGPVVRMQCSVCKSKMATRPLRIEARHGHQLLLNMGPMDDRTLPPPLAQFLQQKRETWQWDRRASWTQAEAQADRLGKLHSNQGPFFLTGSCSCGQSRYRIRLERTTELQHCYCRLCRRVSGGPFQTWVPFDKNDLEWLPPENTDTYQNGSPRQDMHPTSGGSSSHEPPMQRYAPHGRRHVCNNCGGVLTIVYDGSDEVWPAAGAFDEDSLPASSTEELSRQLHSIIHISCRYKQTWYKLPPDGNPRLPEAG